MPLNNQYRRLAYVVAELLDQMHVTEETYLGVRLAMATDPNAGTDRDALLEQIRDSSPNPADTAADFLRYLSDQVQLLGVKRV